MSIQMTMTLTAVTAPGSATSRYEVDEARASSEVRRFLMILLGLMLLAQFYT
jgi:hypothetical protein